MKTHRIKVYDRFIELVKKIYELRYRAEYLAWEGITNYRANVKPIVNKTMALDDKSLKLLTSKEMALCLKKLNNKNVHESLTPEKQTNVRIITNRYDRLSRLPTALVRFMRKASVIAYEKWEEAYNASDFNIFKPALRKIFDLSVEASRLLRDKNIYDGQLDKNEAGCTTKFLDPLFNDLKNKLLHLVKRIESHSIPTPVIKSNFDIKVQERLSREVLKVMGFNFSRGRLDSAKAAYCCGSMYDLRIVNAYNEGDLSSVFGALHEGGHALHEQGFKEKHFCTPMADCNSSALLESQARIYENMVGRSEEFWSYYYPRIKQLFPFLDKISISDFFMMVNKVQRSLIRGEADEVTYNLHVIMRYELEKELFSGKITVDELREVWNDKMNKYLGLTPKNDASGVLQDSHWTEDFGYFSNYALADICAAQLTEQLEKDIPNMFTLISHGNLMPLKLWLNANVHENGSMYNANELVVKLTGKPLNTDSLINYLRRKYSKIYGIRL